MPLAPKISVITIDKIAAGSVVIQDTTGAYNAGTNPGGYGAPNYATTDLDWALLYLRNYSDEDYNIQKISSLTDILGSGQSIPGIVGDKFLDGVWEVKYYPVVAHPVTPGVDTAITWTLGSKTFNLATASTLLAGAIGIIIKDIDDEKIYFLDPATPPGVGTAAVTETLPSAATGLVAIVYEADTRFMMPAAADDCLAIKTGLIIKECTCFDAEMSEMLLRRGKRDGAEVHFAQGNYQAAHDIITQLASYCDNTVNCNC